MANNTLDTAIKSVDKVVTNVQNIASDLALVFAAFIIGLIIAYIAKYLVARLVNKLDVLFRHVAVDDDFKREQIKNNYARILSGIVFAVIFLFTLEICSHIIGWKLFTVWIEKISSFLPRVISSLLIILSGFLFGNITASFIERTGYSFGMLHVGAIAELSKFLIILTLFLVGVEQLGINIGFLTTFIAIIVGVLLSGVTIAFSLGARTLVANIIGAQYVKKQCRIGDKLEINNINGQILNVTKTEIILDTSLGKVVVPAKFFNEQVSIISTGTEEEVDNG